jgi:hypothetical protein
MTMMQKTAQEIVMLNKQRTNCPTSLYETDLNQNKSPDTFWWVK